MNNCVKNSNDKKLFTKTLSIAALAGLTFFGVSANAQGVNVDDNSPLTLEEGQITGAAADLATVVRQNGDREYTASVKNSSGYGLDFIDLTVDLYDKNNKLLSSNSAYANDIKRNETVKLIFYEAAPAKAANYRVTAVNCSRKQ